jgi:hypothetical protein
VGPTKQTNANKRQQGDEIMKINELTVVQRVNRILIGAVMIIATMAVPVVPLGLLALLPLIATYPIFAGMFGYDPLSAVIEFQAGKAIDRAAAHRTGYMRHS